MSKAKQCEGCNWGCYISIHWDTKYRLEKKNCPCCTCIVKMMCEDECTLWNTFSWYVENKYKRGETINVQI